MLRLQRAHRRCHVRVPLVDQHSLQGGEVLLKFLQKGVLVLLEFLEFLLHGGPSQEEPPEDGDREPRLLFPGHRSHQASEDRPGIEVEEREVGPHVSRSLCRRHHLGADLGSVLPCDPPLNVSEESRNAHGGPSRLRGPQGREPRGVQLDPDDRGPPADNHSANRGPDVEHMAHAHERDHTMDHCRANNQSSVFPSGIQREVLSLTTRPYARTISPATTRPSRRVRWFARILWMSTRSLPRSTMSPMTNSSSGAARSRRATVRFPMFTLNATQTRSTRFAQIESISEAFAWLRRFPCDSMAVTTARLSASGSSSPTTTSSSGPISILSRTERSIQLRMRGISIGFGSRLVTLRTAPHAAHFTTPSKTISSFPATLPRRTRCGPSVPHDSHFRTRALGAVIDMGNRTPAKIVCRQRTRSLHPQSDRNAP